MVSKKNFVVLASNGSTGRAEAKNTYENTYENTDENTDEYTYDYEYDYEYDYKYTYKYNYPSNDTHELEEKKRFILFAFRCLNGSV